MNVFVDFIRFNYIYSFSFKDFSGKRNNSLKKPKALILYLASELRNPDISVRSSIKHEFKLSESQKSLASPIGVIPVRKDDEFGRPYFKPLIFKYNFYWSNFIRRHMFFVDNPLSNSYSFSTEFNTNVSDDVSSILNFGFFAKRRISIKKFKFYHFKRKKFKFFYRFPYFNFRSEGLFFSNRPISNSFIVKRSLHTYFLYLRNVSKVFTKFYTDRPNFTFEKDISKFKYFSQFFFTKKFFLMTFSKKTFEIINFLPSTYFTSRISTNFFRTKFKKIFKFPFRVSKRRYFKRSAFSFKIFKFFKKFENFRKCYRSNKLSNFSFQNFVNHMFARSHFFKNGTLFSNFYDFFKFFRYLFFIYRISSALRKPLKFTKLIKSFFRLSSNFKKLKSIFRIFHFFLRTFKIRAVKSFKFFSFALFFQHFFKYYSARFRNFSSINIQKISFNFLLTFVNFFKVGEISFGNFKNTFSFAYFFSLLFRRYTYFKFFKTSFFTKFIFDSHHCDSKFGLTTFKKKIKFYAFTDFYNSFYSTYNIFSFSRYNDFIKFYKNIFNPNFYSYRISSSRKTGKKSFVSTHKAASTTFFSI